MLAVTKKGIEDTRYWEEGRITIDISTEEFVFAMWRMDNEEYEDGREPGVALEVPDTDFDFTAPCSFRDFCKLEKAINDHPNGVRIDDDTVLCWIE